MSDRFRKQVENEPARENMPVEIPEIDVLTLAKAMFNGVNVESMRRAKRYADGDRVREQAIGFLEEMTLACRQNAGFNDSLADQLGAAMQKVEIGLGKKAADDMRRLMAGDRDQLQMTDYSEVVAPIEMRFLGKLQISGRMPRSLSIRLTHLPEQGGQEVVQYLVNPFKDGGVEGIVDLSPILRLVF